ncbi:hypothetical protein [Klebsiella michiganensis]|uniref:hypothetical protein n=1 Tax=Klebsiella michiganensis TaxID=1134687 RepID=UPI003F4FEDDF
MTNHHGDDTLAPGLVLPGTRPLLVAGRCRGWQAFFAGGRAGDICSDPAGGYPRLQRHPDAVRGGAGVHDARGPAGALPRQGLWHEGDADRGEKVTK